MHPVYACCTLTPWPDVLIYSGEFLKLHLPSPELPQPTDQLTNSCLRFQLKAMGLVLVQFKIRRLFQSEEQLILSSAHRGVKLSGSPPTAQSISSNPPGCFSLSSTAMPTRQFSNMPSQFTQGCTSPNSLVPSFPATLNNSGSPPG
jgi:hypothetical protein